VSVDSTHASAGSLLPLVQFPKEKERMRRTIVLIRVWLMVAGFYRRADMHDDANAAIAEAQKLVQVLETELSRDPSGASGLKDAEWAETKTIEDLWGDIYSEVCCFINTATLFYITGSTND
jgi:cargo-transport protein YPP1